MNLKKLSTTVTAAALALTFAFTSTNTASADELSTSTAKASTSATYKATLYVYSYDGTLNMRKSASATSKKIQTLKNGNKITATKKKVVGKTTWVYATVNGKSGWLNASYLTKTKKVTKVSETSSDIIEYGEKFLGTPYVWGGTTPRGFDCSGFSSYVYKNVLGKSLPRTSGAQYAASKHISKANAQPGDLVFFSATGSRITHVAIYAGNNKLLHAAGAHVKYSNLYDGYWNVRLVGFGTFR